jgi:hypothetical protein
MQDRRKQQIAAVPSSMTGTLRYLKTQAIPHCKSTIRHQAFVEITPRAEQALYRRHSHSIARWVFPTTGQALPSDRTQGAEDSRDRLSYVGRRPRRKCKRWFDDPIFRQQRISSSVALDGLGDSPDNKNRGAGVKSQPMNSPGSKSSHAISKSVPGPDFLRYYPDHRLLVCQSHGDSGRCHVR